jgi:hypothetical protein
VASDLAVELLLGVVVPHLPSYVLLWENVQARRCSAVSASILVASLNRFSNCSTIRPY